MLKKSKSDTPKPEKPKKEKPAKPEQPAKDGAKGAPKQAYFWDKWLKKNKKATMVRQSSLPKPTMSKQDKTKLIISGGLFILILIVMFLTCSRGTGGAKDSSPKGAPAPKKASAADASSED